MNQLRQNVTQESCPKRSTGKVLRTKCTGDTSCCDITTHVANHDTEREAEGIESGISFQFESLPQNQVTGRE